jgi:predicted transglutaminase-like cysteine proteinase
MFKKIHRLLFFSLLTVFISLKYINTINNIESPNNHIAIKDSLLGQLQTSSEGIKNNKPENKAISDKKGIIPSKKPENIEKTAAYAEKERAEKAKIAAQNALKKTTKVITSKQARKVFGKTEVQRQGLKLFPKWMQVLEKNKKEKEKSAQKQSEHALELHEDCRYDENPLCLYLDRGKYKKWKTFLKNIENDSKSEQLSKINTFANQNIYIPDHINWGIEDYWASPGEFLHRSGDCEDYAITKYMSLIELGWNMDDMRVIILEDTSLNLIHVVLAVYHEDKINILDNQYEGIIADERIKHYKPIFAVNEKMWWRYY